VELLLEQRSREADRFYRRKVDARQLRACDVPQMLAAMDIGIFPLPISFVMRSHPESRFPIRAQYNIGYFDQALLNIFICGALCRAKGAHNDDVRSELRDEVLGLYEA
jgi:hypothetical protein